MQHKYMAACIQLSSSYNIEENLNTCEELIREAAQHFHAKLICLPENFAFLGRQSEKVQRVEEINNLWKSRLLPLAKELDVSIIAGGHPERTNESEKVYNVSSFISREGKITHQYNKMHLFDVDIPEGVKFQESKTVASGKDYVIVEDKVLGNVGLSICYDLRFPELYRKLTAKGANLLVVTAAFALFTGKDHWLVLLRARAIENQCYLLAANQWGVHSSSYQSYGNSCIVNPWGKVIACCHDRVGLIAAEINPLDLKKIREEFPCLQHRKLGVSS